MALVCDPPAAKSSRLSQFANAPGVTRKFGLPQGHAGGTCYSAIVFEFYHMATLRYFPIAPGRKLGAWVCLAALLLLWSPAWAAAWHTEEMACCSGGMCLAHQHSKSGPSHQGQSKETETPMNCEHHGTTGLTSCSMSCCQESSTALTAGIIFVLPEPTSLSQPSEATAAPVVLSPVEFLQSLEPLSPPPRISLFSL
jgi:hypothetical protein